MQRGMLDAAIGFRKLRTNHAQVVHKLGLDIVSGFFKTGDILPGDAELMERLKVSRTVLREAMKTLTAKGMISPKARIGTRVTERESWNMFDSEVLLWHFEAGVSEEFLLHLYDIRQAFEPYGAGLAAIKAKDADIARLVAYANEMGNTAYSKEKRALADMNFHVLITEMSGNPFMRTVGSLIKAALVGIFRMSNPEADPNEISDVSASHLRLVEAFRLRDEAAARREMERLIENGRQQILEFTARNSRP